MNDSSAPICVKGISSQIVVPDVVNTAEYYRDIYGFTIEGYFLDPPVYSIVSRNGFQIHFGRSDGNELRLNRSIRKGSFDLYIVVSDIDRMLAQLREKNAEILEGVVKRIYGSREITTRDCNGHIVTFGD
ncbi:MAG TPA: VOC family protein [Bacteroidota bacterium]|nr:VOC family protein [Bacteroidota bacterium]